MIYHFLHFNIIMYADDTTLYGNSEHFLADFIETEIDNNLEYLNKWLLLLFRKRKITLKCISESTIFLY